MSSDELRQNAAYFLKVAELLDGDTKRLLIEIAASWIKVAEQLEKRPRKIEGEQPTDL